MIPLEDRLYYAAEYLQKILKIFAPKDTGNLSANAIRLVSPAPGIWDIVIGGELAPYAVYTNEPWISEKWGGKKNPNEGWVQRAIKFAMPMVQTIMSGYISEQDLMNTLDKQDVAFRTQLYKLWESKLRLSKYEHLVEKYGSRKRR